jgi:GNAT superfamily N-acetyltransferase
MIRRATEKDVEAILGLIEDLAEYERFGGRVDVDADRLRDSLFGDNPAVFAHVAEEGDQVVGTAIWFLNYSTWTGAHGIYLEDLFVRPEARGRGLGKALLVALAQVAVEAGYRRVEWSVLNWNELALGFYRSVGAVPMDEWSVYRLADGALATLAAAPA